MNNDEFDVSISILARQTRSGAGVHEFVTREFKITDKYTKEDLDEMVTNLSPAYLPDKQD